MKSSPILALSFGFRCLNNFKPQLSGTTLVSCKSASLFHPGERLLQRTGQDVPQRCGVSAYLFGRSGVFLPTTVLADGVFMARWGQYDGFQAHKGAEQWKAAARLSFESPLRDLNSDWWVSSDWLLGSCGSKSDSCQFEHVENSIDPSGQICFETGLPAKVSFKMAVFNEEIFKMTVFIGRRSQVTL